MTSKIVARAPRFCLEPPGNGAIIALITGPNAGGITSSGGEHRSPTLSRQRKPYYVQQKVSIPATLLARFSRFHWDAAKNKVQYGAISDILTGLLSDYVNRMENPSIVPDQLEGEKEKVS